MKRLRSLWGGGEQARRSGVDWDIAGMELGEALNAYHAVVVIGVDPIVTGRVAVGIGRAQAQRRRVAVGDLFGESPPIQSLVQTEDPHGLVDSFLYGVSLSRIAYPVADAGQLFVMPSGTESPDYDEILPNPRWHRLAAGFREVGALLVLAAPAGAPHIEELVAATDGAILIGDTARRGLSASSIITSLQSRTTPAEPLPLVPKQAAARTQTTAKAPPPPAPTRAVPPPQAAQPTQNKWAPPQPAPTKAAPSTQSKAAPPQTQSKATAAPTQAKAAPPPTQTKAAPPPPQTKAAPPPPQTKAAPPPQTKAAPPPQTKAAPPPPQTKAAPPPPQTKAAPPPQTKAAPPPPAPTKAAPPPPPPKKAPQPAPSTARVSAPTVPAPAADRPSRPRPAVEGPAEQTTWFEIRHWRATPARRATALLGIVLAQALAFGTIWFTARQLGKTRSLAAKTDSAARAAAGDPRASSKAGDILIAPRVTNPADSEQAAAYSVELVSANTQVGAISRLQADSKKVPAATFSPVLVSRSRWFKVLGGAYVDPAEADSLLVTLRQQKILKPGEGRVVQAPYAFLIESGVKAAAVPGMLAMYAQQGQPVYALRQADGTAWLLAGAFETLDESALYAESLRSSGPRPALVYRKGRPF